MQHSPLRLRQGTHADALVIGVLGMQVSLDTYATQGIRPLLAREVLAHFSTAAISSLLAQPHTRFVLAERDGHLIGFAQLAFGERHALVLGDPTVEVERLFVQARFKGQGVGKTLIGAASGQARASGAMSLWLTAWVGNKEALAWYRLQGWLERGVTDYVFEDEHFENRLFELQLDTT
jgi:GNAT superfamily N-acetyltransferase